MTKTTAGREANTGLFVNMFGFLNIGISDLFRISEFGFRIYFACNNASNGRAFSILIPLGRRDGLVLI